MLSAGVPCLACCLEWCLDATAGRVGRRSSNTCDSGCDAMKPVGELIATGSLSYNLENTFQEVGP